MVFVKKYDTCFEKGNKHQLVDYKDIFNKFRHFTATCRGFFTHLRDDFLT